LKGDQHFDVYVQSGDGYCHHNMCSWDIVVIGLCKNINEIRYCFTWSTPNVERKLFVQKNNNI